MSFRGTAATDFLYCCEDDRKAIADLFERLCQETYGNENKCFGYFKDMDGHSSLWEWEEALAQVSPKLCHWFRLVLLHENHTVIIGVGNQDAPLVIYNDSSHDWPQCRQMDEATA